MRQLLVIFTLFAVGYGLYYYVDYHKTRAPSPVVFDVADAPSLGEGPLCLVTFQDFLCPGCQHFHEKVYPRLKKRYILTGKVRYQVVPLAFLPGSREIAHAALAVHEVKPSSFFAYIDLLYANRGTYRGKTVEELLQEAGRIPDLSLPALQQAAISLDSRAILTRNFATAELAMQNRVATPGVFVDGVDISDYSFAEMVQYIDRKLWENRAQ
ncbi:MAG: thioredoxin domain-containing protein [Chlamydiota bacterium]